MALNKLVQKNIRKFQFIFIFGFIFSSVAIAGPYKGVISDSHSHIRSGVKYKKVIEQMDKSNVDIIVIMSHDEAVTDKHVMKFHKKFPDRVIPAISFQHSRWFDQDSGYMKYVDKLAGKGKYHWLGEASVRGKIDGKLNMPPSHKMLHQLLDLSVKHKLPVAIHHNSTNKKEVDKFVNTLEKHPDATVIWAHWCGLSTPKQARTLLDKLPNLRCDLAWLHKHKENMPTKMVNEDNEFLPEWKKLIEEKPDRFLAGIDASKPGHYKKKYFKWVRKLRGALGGLNPKAARMVATENLHKILKDHN